MKQPQDEFYLRLSKENVFTFILNLIGTSLSLAAYQHYPSNIQGRRTNNLHYHIPLPHTCSSILSPAPLCTSHPASTPSRFRDARKFNASINQLSWAQSSICSLIAAQSYLVSWVSSQPHSHSHNGVLSSNF